MIVQLPLSFHHVLSRLEFQQAGAGGHDEDTTEAASTTVGDGLTTDSVPETEGRTSSGKETETEGSTSPPGKTPEKEGTEQQTVTGAPEPTAKKPLRLRGERLLPVD